ncbi:hypothetical protein [Kutzneria sp. NPDC052558]|uniref:hypothetical protein n=1 Tax=Kutzneria sp. NPDC052558 TaxID=3364121 RepID=UPI0037CB7367
MVEIDVDVESLSASRSGAIWGDVWFTMNGDPFPERGWNDLVIALLVEFQAALGVVDGGDSVRRVRFFDGPYWVEFESLGQGGVKISTNTGLVASCGKVEVEGLVRRLGELGRELVDACAAKGFEGSDDVKRLDRLSAR